MAEDAYWFDDFTTLDLQDGTDTTVPIAGIQGLTITPTVETANLFTADSMKREAVKQYEGTVDVSIEYAKFDQDASVVQQWLAGGGNSTSTSWTDTSDPQQFAIDFTTDSDGGDRTMDVSVSGIVFPEMPIVDSSMNEYVTRDLSGTGADIDDMSMTDNTSV